MKKLANYLFESFADVEQPLLESFSSDQLRTFVMSNSKYFRKEMMSSVHIQFDKITDEDLFIAKNGSDFTSSNIRKIAKADGSIRLWFDTGETLRGATIGENVVWLQNDYDRRFKFKTVAGAAKNGFNAIVIDKKFGTKVIRDERFMNKADAIAFKTNDDLMYKNGRRLKEAAAELRLTRFIQSGGGKDLLLDAETMMDEANAALQATMLVQDWVAVDNIVRCIRDIAYQLNNAKSLYVDYDDSASLTDSKIEEKTKFTKKAIMSAITSAKESLEKIKSYNTLD